MAVPTQLSDLSATAASNSPAGSDTVGTTMDDFIRSHASIIARISAGTDALATPNIGAATGTSVVLSGAATVNGAATMNGAFTSRGIDDNATAVALTLSGSGANSVTIANSATTPAIGTSAGALAITAAISATSTISAGGSIQCNNDDATPAGGGPGICLLIGSAGIGIYIGSGIPSVSATDGSIYIRTDGSAGACIYQRRSSAWVATNA